MGICGGGGRHEWRWGWLLIEVQGDIYVVWGGYTR